MKAAKAKLKDAEKVKRYLLENQILDKDHHYDKDEDHIYFPVTRDADHPSVEMVDLDLPEDKKVTKLREALKEELTPKEMEALKTSFDTVGTIAILDVPEELRPKEKLLAQRLLKLQPGIRTVLKKSGIHEGEFRTQPLEYLGGEDTKTAFYKENDVSLKLDVEKVYFSPRLSTERKRIAEQVKPGEEVLVMFSGCAPYPCVIARNTDAKRIVGVELNPAGHKFGLENLRLNKITNVELINADVREAVPNLGKFDRILMPLPKSAEDFLDCALEAAKEGTMIHFYDFLHEDDIPEKTIDKIDKACKKHEIIGFVKCGQYAPRTFRICVDFQVG